LKINIFYEAVSWQTVEFWQIKNILEKNDNSGIIDSCLGYGRPQTAHILEKITAVKINT